MPSIENLEVDEPRDHIFDCAVGTGGQEGVSVAVFRIEGKIHNIIYIIEKPIWPHIGVQHGGVHYLLVHDNTTVNFLSQATSYTNTLVIGQGKQLELLNY